MNEADRIYSHHAASYRSIAAPASKADDACKTTLTASPWHFWKTRCRYYVPMFQWLPAYSTTFFCQDLFSGVSLSFLFIPQALSYSTALLGIAPIHGLYSVSISTIIYAFTGMSPQLSVGPEASTSLIVGASIAHQQAHTGHTLDAEGAAAIASLMAFLVGIITLMFGFFRFGFLDSLLSRALMCGLITAVAIVIMIQQAIMLLGLAQHAADAGLTSESTSAQRVSFLVAHAHEAHPLTTYVSLATLFWLAIMPTLKHRVPALQKFPEMLIVVIASIVLSRACDWQHRGVAILGTVSGNATFHAPLPLPALPKTPANLDYSSLIVNAIILSIVGFVESIAGTKLFAQKHNYFVSSNRELVAFGLCNIFGGLMQGYPSFGSLLRSKAHEMLNPRTQVSGLISGVVSLVVTSTLMSSFTYLPTAVLSSVIFMAATALLRELPHDLRFMWRIRAWKDIALLILVFCITMFFSLETGTSVAVLLSLVSTIKQNSYPRISVMGRVKGSLCDFQAMSTGRKVEQLDGVLIVRMDDPLYFANCGKFKDLLHRLEQYGDLSVHPAEEPRYASLQHVVFDFGSMDYIDASAVHQLYEIISVYQTRRVKVYLVNIHPNIIDALTQSSVLELVGSHHIFDSITQAIQCIDYDAMIHPIKFNNP
ncbi:sulfate transporter family-domain-containing protein [Gongronella butleri]|nr:sulfate transporter family-domain-containing protein [Gongronella butleri]